MDHCTCAPGARWCSRTDAIFGSAGMHVIDVARDDRGRLVLSVETDQTVRWLPDVRGGRGRSRWAPPPRQRRPVLRPGHGAGVGQADLAVCRAELSSRNVSPRPTH